ncbi:MAG: sugar ABC transporter ATP-binding protein [Pseudomonadota bacterium]|uniref:sugar ABC transporter ATP-binding protein n=1 Tax=Ralstonia pickettii TaxID=329 RepID=UPI002714C866|nr:sugar ABC transporter ATP-binding protein [Ralstonia pickettii]MEE2978251.1 sugar ABC transporter ATP-binding protein [Pseudomonadota bacterium]WKZ86186.1 sugar ABC transporter ATP-binding protein [Ralstonia pickettii]
MSAAYEPRTPLLRVSALSKHYAAPVLRDIDLDVHAGEVLALTGENGAGKSTLSKILCGLETATSGSMTLAGALYAPDSRSAAEALGVRMVLQELSMVPTLTVAENLFLGDLPRRLGFVDRSALRHRAAQALARVGLDLDPWTPVQTLGIGHRQMIEIARALASACRVLILDEPTAMLSAHESATLFERIDALRREGVAILYISHRLDELARIADRIVVLRDGKLVTDAPAATVTQDALIQAMVGREVAAASETQRATRAPWPGDGSPALRVTGLTRTPAVRDVSFDVAPGEIFGIAGLVGAGRTEVLRLIFGADRADAGTVEAGSPLAPVRIRSPGDAVRNGISLLTEDRKDEGLMLSLPIATNIALGNMPVVTKRGWLQPAQERALAHRHIGALRVRCAGPQQPVGELSGGNQQKVAIARWLERDTPVLLFDEPTRGVDVGAKFDIYTLLEALAARGKALVVVSSDLRELMQLCDRIGVMRAGRLTHIFQRGGWSQDALLAAAFGESEESESPAPQFPSETADAL